MNLNYILIFKKKKKGKKEKILKAAREKKYIIYRGMIRIIF